jgi:hypothetical protein
MFKADALRKIGQVFRNIFKELPEAFEYIDDPVAFLRIVLPYLRTKLTRYELDVIADQFSIYFCSGIKDKIEQDKMYNQQKMLMNTLLQSELDPGLFFQNNEEEKRRWKDEIERMENFGDEYSNN